MALTKVGKEGITGISNASDATFLTATAAEGVTLAGTLAVTGVHTVGTNAVATSDGGAVTTNIVQGLVKLWSSLKGTDTFALLDSFNVSGATDGGTGTYTITINNNMSNIQYAANATNASEQSEGIGFYGEAEVTTSDTKYYNFTPSAASDNDLVVSQIAGDLA
jgi:hypothetical protein